MGEPGLMPTHNTHSHHAPPRRVSDIEISPGEGADVESHDVARRLDSVSHEGRVSVCARVSVCECVNVRVSVW